MSGIIERLNTLKKEIGAMALGTALVFAPMAASAAYNPPSRQNTHASQQEQSSKRDIRYENHPFVGFQFSYDSNFLGPYASVSFTCTYPEENKDFTFGIEALMNAGKIKEEFGVDIFSEKVLNHAILGKAMGILLDVGAFYQNKNITDTRFGGGFGIKIGLISSEYTDGKSLTVVFIPNVNGGSSFADFSVGAVFAGNLESAIKGVRNQRMKDAGVGIVASVYIHTP